MRENGCRKRFSYEAFLQRFYRIMIIKKTHNAIREFFRREKNLSEECKTEIAKENITLIRICSILASILIVFFVLLTPTIYAGWHISLPYIFFLIVMLASTAVSSIIEKKPKLIAKLSQMLCFMFYIVLMCFIFAIDITVDPGQTCFFFPEILIVVSIALIWRFRTICILNIISTGTFLICVKLLKSPEVMSADYFHSAVGLLTSLCAVFIVTRLRMRDNLTKKRYKTLSMTDSLTGLLNKGTCEACIKDYLKNKKFGLNAALFMIDIDGFKNVNDTRGHLPGDRLLYKTGKVLKSSFRTTDILGRFGGDEFIVLMVDFSGTAVVENKSKAIRKAFEIYCSEDEDFRITCSIGAVIFDDEIPSFDELLTAADALLYKAKEAGKDRYRIGTLTSKGLFVEKFRDV